MCLVTVKQEMDFLDERFFEIKKEDDNEPAVIVFQQPIEDLRKIKPKVDKPSKTRAKQVKKANAMSFNPDQHMMSTASKLEIKINETESPPASPRFDDNDSLVSPLNDEKAELSDDDNMPKAEIAKKVELMCNLCVKKVELRDDDDYNIHMKLVHQDLAVPFLGPYKCENYGKARHCTKFFPYEKIIRKHIRQFHLFRNEKLCTTCGQTFYDRRSFYCHIDKNHGIRVRKYSEKTSSSYKILIFS